MNDDVIGSDDLYTKDNVSMELMQKLGPKALGDAGPLSGGGGGMSGLETRVAVIETHVDQIRTDVSDLKSDVRVLSSDMSVVRERLTKIEATMATKGFTVTVTLVVLAMIAALITFQGQIQAFVGVAP